MLTGLSWSAAPALPAPRTDAIAVTAANDTVYLLGGDAAGVQAVSVPTLAPNAQTWSTGPKVDTQRIDPGAAVSGSHVILFGGTGGTEGINEVLDYDYVLGDSQDLAKMNLPRYDFGSAVDSGGRVYAIGGIGVRDNGEIWSQVERYDLATDTWSLVAPLPLPLHGLSAIGDGAGHIYVFGGSSTLGDAGIQADSFKYDVASDTWTAIFPMPIATRDSAVVMDQTGKIYVTGGRTTSGATDAVQSYDPTTNRWSIEAPLPQAVYSHAATITSNGRILVAGGYGPSGAPTAAAFQTQRLNVPSTPPVIQSQPSLAASIDTAYSYDVEAVGNPDPTYSLTAAPAGMVIDSTSGAITWQPQPNQIGVHSVTVLVTNSVGSVEQTFEITVAGDTTAPTTPVATVDRVTETTADLSWTASTDATGIDRYEIFSVVHRRQRWRRWNEYTLVATVPGTTPSTTISGLLPLTTANYVVQGVDVAGNRSNYSNEVTVRTLAKPELSIRFGQQTTGPIQTRANSSLEFQLWSNANPDATFSIVEAPAGVSLVPNSLDTRVATVSWTPGPGQVGMHTMIFRGSNSVGETDLSVTVEVLADAPLLSVAFNPTSGGERFAVVGNPFTAQVNDASSTPSVYALLTSPVGMTIHPNSGLISWTPANGQGGTHTVTVQATNAGGTTELTFDVLVYFTGAVENVSVTGATLANPTVTWSLPTGAGSDLVTGYRVNAFTKYRSGSHTFNYRTHSVDYMATRGSESVELTGLLTGKTYTITITPIDAAGNLGLPNATATVTPNPALPDVKWTVNGYSGGTSTPAFVVAEQPVLVSLADRDPATSDPATFALVSGPSGLSFDPGTNTANWVPTSNDVTSGYSTTDILFRATNSVGSVDVVVPIRVFFSGAVQNASATKEGTAVTAHWSPPVDNVFPIAGYQITTHWTWAGRARSSTRTVPGNVTSASWTQFPTGAVSYRGIRIVPVDANGNVGLDSGLIPFGSPPNNAAPIATDDTYEIAEDTLLTVAAPISVVSNDTDADGNVLSVQLVAAPHSGVVDLASNGTFTYMPAVDFHGTDSFTYVAHDGRYSSNVATVSINVTPVNDAPVALDDYYTTPQDTPLSVPPSGVLANDSDVDGDSLTASINFTQPANGTVVLNADGSFVYTPNNGFVGKDTWTYVATDGTLTSLPGIVTIDVQPTSPSGTKFFVVDLARKSTFEYGATGSLVESYSLSTSNRKPMGVATNSDGSLVWTVDKEKSVFVYDYAGHVLGAWQPLGVEKPDGIATDGTHVWIVDRALDQVFYYQNAAAQRSGSLQPTSSFPLARGNRNAKGITTDGVSIWTVNNGASVDRVFKYDTAGNLLGKWVIDAMNSVPTGIAINPNNLQHIWIVDLNSARVYQYDGGTSRLAGKATASSAFDLDPTNTKPQGIADPARGDVRLHPLDESHVRAFQPFDLNAHTGRQLPQRELRKNELKARRRRDPIDGVTIRPEKVFAVQHRQNENAAPEQNAAELHRIDNVWKALGKGDMKELQWKTLF